MPNKKVTVEGIVTPCDWDNKEFVKSVTISTNTEEEFIVDETGKGEELRGLIRQLVHVTGIVKECGQGKKMIRVKNYKVVDAFENNNL